MKKTKIKWLNEPQKHDYPAAKTYLSLLMDPDSAQKAADDLEAAPMQEFAAKDIFRASQLPLLGAGNSHVEKDREQIITKQALSPLLLIADRRQGPLIIADGYHRLCATYTFDEDAMIPCKIIYA